jgi:hypothetical protein
MRFPAAITIARERGKPFRNRNSDKFRREHWWLFGRPYKALRAAVVDLSRYIAAGRVGKRLLFVWCEPWACANDATYVFAFDDDYSMGVLSSFAHGAWAWASTLKGDCGIRRRQCSPPFHGRIWSLMTSGWRWPRRAGG